MTSELVEIKGPGGLAKVAKSDVKRYLRRPGYSLAGIPKAPKKAAKTDRIGKDLPKTEKNTDEKKAADDRAAAFAAAAKEDKAGFEALLASVKKATTPELETIVDTYDLGVQLSRIKIVADRRKAVADALQRKMAKG